MLWDWHKIKNTQMIVSVPEGAVLANLCHIPPFRSRGNLAGGRADGFCAAIVVRQPYNPGGAV